MKGYGLLTLFKGTLHVTFGGAKRLSDTEFKNRKNVIVVIKRDRGLVYVLHTLLKRLLAVEHNVIFSRGAMVATSHRIVFLN